MSNSLSQDLNPAQREAVLAPGGPILILAGAGAGKTKTITERIRHLIVTGTAPSSILAITFTNKAAREMRERVDRSLSEDGSLNKPIEMFERPLISTFHSLGVHILREQSSFIGLRKHFSIYDREDSKKAIRESLEKLDLDPKTHEPGKILSIISKEKGRGVTSKDYGVEGKHGGYWGELVEKVWHEYEKILTREQALDFDDLLLKTRNILAEHEQVREHYKNIWRHILIDEYQDTNKVQYEIARMLVGRERNICVVGDVDQNIYSWRGADIRNILDFEKDYPEARVIVLEENYRSTQTILEAANTVIEKNKHRRPKNLRTSNSSGEKIGLVQIFDESSEAYFIAEKARELIAKGIPPEEIAVLYRANFQSRILEESFMRLSVPYQILGTRFFERKEVKDIVAYLRLALNPDSLSDMKRIINVPRRGIGKATVAKIFAGDESGLSPAMSNKIKAFRKTLGTIKDFVEQERPSEVIKKIIEISGLAEEWKEGGREENAARLENAYELANFASRYDSLSAEEGILAFLSDAALQSDQDEMRDDGKAVRLLTVHASKGLEFGTVFIAGLEEGLFPHHRADDESMTPEESEEERRLFYVAITRAKKKLYLSYAQTRTVFGRKQVNIPSEFIFDIPENLVEQELFDDSNMPRKSLLDIDF